VRGLGACYLHDGMRWHARLAWRLLKRWCALTPRRGRCNNTVSKNTVATGRKVVITGSNNVMKDNVQSNPSACHWIAGAFYGLRSRVRSPSATRLHSLGRAWAVLRAVLARKVTGSPPAERVDGRTTSGACRRPHSAAG
jgi:hypothetical protein